MKNFFPAFLILAAFALGCAKSGANSISESLGFSDETAEAAALVGKANEDLREIRKIQKTNIGKLEDLKEAMSQRDAAKTRQILDELTDAMRDGIALGETAAAQIDHATEKKTNDKFNEYLRLKQQALEKQIAAFKFRLEVAKTLRDKFGSSDQKEVEAAKADFVRQEDNFQKLWEAAEDLNDRANRLARENPSKVKAK